eukprot:RCo011679
MGSFPPRLPRSPSCGGLASLALVLAFLLVRHVSTAAAEENPASSECWGPEPPKGRVGGLPLPQLREQWFHRCLRCSGAWSALPARFPLMPTREHFGDVQRLCRNLSGSLNGRMHSYRGYRGPWIENLWIRAVQNKRLDDWAPMVPLLVPWSDLLK